MNYFRLILKEYQNLLEDMRFGFGRFIKYQIGTKLLLSSIVIPIYAVIFELSMQSRGMETISNSQILKFVLSPEGFLLLIMLFLIATFIILLEIGGLTLLSYQSYERQAESSFRQVVKFCLKKMSQFLSLGGILIILNLLILGPLLGLGIHTSVITHLEIPGYIMDYIEQRSWVNFLYISLLIIAFVCVFRWAFAIHYIILENKIPKDALKASARLIKRNFKEFLAYIIGITFISMFLILLIELVWFVIVVFVISGSNITTALGKFIISFFALLKSFSFFLTSFILLPIQIMLLTRLFFYLKAKNKEEKYNLVIEEKAAPSILDWVFRKRKTIVFLLLIALSTIATISSLVFDQFLNEKYNIAITAHRGSSLVAPENTVSAIKAAIDHEADYAEIDVQMTKDKKIVLLHDNSLKRIAGVTKKVSELNYSEIKKLDVGSYFNQKFAGERIPLLEDVIDASKGKIKLNIELKQTKPVKEIAREVIKIIERKNFTKECVVTSLDYNILQEVEKLNSQIKTGYIMYLASGDLGALNVDFYSIEESNVDEDMIIDAHSIGREVHIWTINDPEDLERLLILGVDNIITDHDQEFREALKDHKRNDTPFNRLMNIFLVN